MTVTELIAELQKLEAEGHGALPVAYVSKGELDDYVVAVDGAIVRTLESAGTALFDIKAGSNYVLLEM